MFLFVLLNSLQKVVFLSHIFQALFRSQLSRFER